jgi:hypothetical protein
VKHKVLLASILVLLSISPGAWCGGDENDGPKLPPVKDVAPEDQSFHVNGEADRYSGPAPHKVQFAAEAFNASGDVRWFWIFDDGTTSRERNPTHTFREPGYYLVQVEAIDEKKHPAARGLFLGIWPAKTWAKAQRGEVNQPLEVRKQRIRTRRRKRRLRELCRKNPRCRRDLERRRSALAPPAE